MIWEFVLVGQSEPYQSTKAAKHNIPRKKMFSRRVSDFERNYIRSFTIYMHACAFYLANVVSEFCSVLLSRCDFSSALLPFTGRLFDGVASA